MQQVCCVSSALSDEETQMVCLSHGVYTLTSKTSDAEARAELEFEV